MFIQLIEDLKNRAPGTTSGAAADKLFRHRTVDILNHLESLWASPKGPSRFYGDHLVEEERRALSEPDAFRKEVTDANVRPPVPGATGLKPAAGYEATLFAWRHLGYAFLVENTRILEVFRRVLEEMLTSERLGRPDHVVLSWIRTTEELFFTDRLGHWILSPKSELRPDQGAIRRNAYFRMFGADLSHGLPDGRPFSYVKPETANHEFVATFEQLLREVWRGYVNRDNKVGANTTDAASLADLAHRLQDMMRDRRMYGALAREEFYCDAVLSWFHVTVGCDNAVVRMLNAEGNNAAERLRNIGERVGVLPHSRSYNYLEMSEEFGDLLSEIELGTYSTPTAAEKLFTDPPTASKILTIVNHWSAASGRNLKEWVGEPDGFRSALPAARMTVPLLPMQPVQVVRVPPV